MDLIEHNQQGLISHKAEPTNQQTYCFYFVLNQINEDFFLSFFFVFGLYLPYILFYSSLDLSSTIHQGIHFYWRFTSGIHLHFGWGKETSDSLLMSGEGFRAPDNVSKNNLVPQTSFFNTFDTKKGCKGFTCQANWTDLVSFLCFFVFFLLNGI